MVIDTPIKIWEKIAAGGNPKAMLLLGKAYWDTDRPKAVHWLQRASQLGEDEATDLLHQLQPPRAPLISAKNAIIYGAMLTLMGLVGLIACDPKDNHKPVSTEGPKPTLHESGILTTQISNDLRAATTNMSKATEELNATTGVIAKNAANGKIATPKEAQQAVFPFFDAILAQIKTLFALEGTYKSVETQLTNTRADVDRLTAMNKQATAKYDESEKAWTKAINDRDKSIKQKDEKITKLSTDLVSKTRKVLLGFMGLGILMVAGGVISLFWFPKAVGNSVICGGAVLGGLGLLMSETIWVWWWVGLVALILATAYGTYRLIQYEIERRKKEKEQEGKIDELNNAVAEVTQTAEVAKDLLGEASPDARELVFGNHIISGEADRIQSTKTQAIVARVRQTLRRRARSMPVRPILAPSDGSDINL